MPKPDRSCTYVDRDGPCGQNKNGDRHGIDGDHFYVAPPRDGFGSKGSRLNPRSAKTERYYEEVRRPAVAEAVGDGRRPCQIRAPGCTGYGTTLHEPASRGRFGGLRAAVEAGGTVLACPSCNRYVSEHPVWAAEHMFMQSDTLDGKRHSPKGVTPRVIKSQFTSE